MEMMEMLEPETKEWLIKLLCQGFWTRFDVATGISEIAHQARPQPTALVQGSAEWIGTAALFAITVKMLPGIMNTIAECITKPPPENATTKQKITWRKDALKACALLKELEPIMQTLRELHDYVVPPESKG